MSALTLQQLYACDPRPFARAAQAWKQLAEDIDNTAEGLIRSTRDLQDAWSVGPASADALQQMVRLRHEVSNTYNPARRIYQALDRHAGTMTELRGSVEGIVDEARRAGLDVDLVAGTVTARDEQGAALVDRYAGELGGVLSRARGLDDSTANTIAVNCPDPKGGFGLWSLPPVRRAELEAMRGKDPKALRAWWESLTPEQQEQAIRDYPDLVGWMDGIPAGDRDTANRIRLQQDLDDLRRRHDALAAQIAYVRAHPESMEAQARGDFMNDAQLDLADVDRKLADLNKVGGKLDELRGKGEQALLLGIDPAGDGKAVIALGDPDKARHTAVWVPGLGTELGDTGGNVNRVLNLQHAADRLTAEPDDVATIMWLGYDAPELNTSVLTSGRSEQGGTALASFANGLRATHDDGASHLTVVGHSYGSTVVAEAALHGDGQHVDRLVADDIVVAGSPGMHTDHAADLQVGARHVWAAAAAGDHVADDRPVIGLGSYGHGEAPQSDDFGGNRLATDTHGHSDYWKNDTLSLDNQAFVVVGMYDSVVLEHGSPPR